MSSPLTLPDAPVARTSFSRWALVALLLLGLVLGSGYAVWWNAQRPVSRHVSLFYADQQGMVLVPVAADVTLPKPEEPGAWAQAVFETLKQTRDPKLSPGVAPDMRLVEATWLKPGWTLGVKMPAGGGSTTERMLAGSLVRTFIASYPGTEFVKLKFLGPDGKPLQSQHMDYSAPLTALDFPNRMEAAPAAGLQATLWWKVKDGADLVPVQMALGAGSGSPPHDALDRLMAGPPQEAGAFLQPVAPVGFKATWSDLQGDVARVTLLTDLPPGEAGAQCVKAIVLTLTEFESVKAVQFLRDQAPASGQVGPFSLSEPIKRPADANAPAADSRS